MELNVLTAGAVEAVVRDIVGSLEKESGHTVKLTYAPVGALRDRIFAGEPADLTIVTPMDGPDAGRGRKTPGCAPTSHHKGVGNGAS